jgi:hypothetical protein
MSTIVFRRERNDTYKLNGVKHVVKEDIIDGEKGLSFHFLSKVGEDKFHSITVRQIAGEDKFSVRQKINDKQEDSELSLAELEKMVKKMKELKFVADYMSERGKYKSRKTSLKHSLKTSKKVRRTSLRGGSKRSSKKVRRTSKRGTKSHSRKISGGAKRKSSKKTRRLKGGARNLKLSKAGDAKTVKLINVEEDDVVSQAKTIVETIKKDPSFINSAPRYVDKAKIKSQAEKVISLETKINQMIDQSRELSATPDEYDAIIVMHKLSKGDDQ